MSKEGMGLIEQGMQQIINKEVQPQVEAVKAEIGKAREEIKAAQSEFSKIKEAADKSVENAKNIVQTTMADEIDKAKKESASELARAEKDLSDSINEKQLSIDNIMGRLQKFEKSIQGKMDLCVVERDNDNTYTFSTDEKASNLQYYIGGAEFSAKAKDDGTFAGPHIVSSVRKGKEHIIKLDKKLDQGSSFSIKLDKDSLEKRVEELENSLGQISGILKSFATKVTS